MTKEKAERDKGPAPPSFFMTGSFKKKNKCHVSEHVCSIGVQEKVPHRDKYVYEEQLYAGQKTNK